jgi:hypothetical protein
MINLFKRDIMKNRHYIKNFGFVALMLLFSVTVSAQEALRTGYFLKGNAYRYRINPAMTGDQNFVSLPTLGNLTVNSAGNFGLANFIYKAPNGTDLVTFMHPSVKADDFLGALDTDNRMSSNLDLTLFSAGFRAFGGYNTIADQNKKLVENLDMGTAAKAYLACHIELDRALEYLIRRLTEAGKLDRTVIAITTDHFPYGLTDANWKEMIGHNIMYGGMERYKSDLIIWNSAMETVKIDKPCSNPDLLPTLLNLFGFEYDSRLYSGQDILSDSYGLAMMSNQSFVTDKLIYNSRYEKYYLLDESFQVPENYIETYTQIVKNRFSIAASMLTNDFFSRLPKDILEAAQRGDSVSSIPPAETPATP